MNIQLTPIKQKSLDDPTPTFNVSPVKVPVGAKHVGNYILGKTLGSGTFGKVHLGLHIQSGEKVAIKIIEKQKLNGKDLQHIHRQIEILKTVCHPSIIQLYEIIQTEKSLLIVMEYMPNGQLFNYILEKKKLCEREACQIFHQIIDGVQYLHSLGIAHRDLKPENIMMGCNRNVKIIDFGLGNKYKPNQYLKTECGSPCYASPEMISGKKQYQPLRVDIWSCGVVLYAMIAGYLPFCDPDTSKLFKKIVSGTYSLPLYISFEAQDLISNILVTAPKKRLKLEQIKAHKWFNQIKYIPRSGIDLRLHKMPTQKFLINHIQAMGVVSKKFSSNLQNNIKNKQTAIYYLIAQKLVREGHQLKSFFNSPAFDTATLHSLINDSYDTVEGETVSSIQTPDQIMPKSEQLPMFNLKSDSFKPILLQFLKAQGKEGSSTKKREAFYGNNSDNGKKKAKLTTPSTKQRAQTLFHIRKKQNIDHRLLGSLKKNDKKMTIDIIQNINNLQGRRNTIKTGQHRRIAKNNHRTLDVGYLSS